MKLPGGSESIFKIG